MESQKNNDKFQISKVIAAIREAKGVKADAARILKCDYHTITSYMNRYATVRKAYEQATSEVTDVARGNVVKAILSGDLDISKWWLTKKADEEGFGDKKQISGDLNLNVRTIAEILGDDEP